MNRVKILYIGGHDSINNFLRLISIQKRSDLVVLTASSKKEAISILTGNIDTRHLVIHGHMEELLKEIQRDKKAMVGKPIINVISENEDIKKRLEKLGCDFTFAAPQDFLNHIAHFHQQM